MTEKLKINFLDSALRRRVVLASRAMNSSTHVNRCPSRLARTSLLSAQGTVAPAEGEME